MKPAYIKMFFQRNVLLNHPTGYRRNRLKPNSSFSLDFKVAGRPQKISYELRVIGETDEFWKWRAENGNPYWLAETIEDSLVREVFPDENYALLFSGHGDEFERNAYMLLKSGTFHPGVRYRFEVPAKSENLTLAPGGEAVCELGIYLRKAGRDPDDVYDLPDHLVQLKLSPGTHDGAILSKTFTMPENAVALLVRIGYRRAGGKVWFGTPRLLTAGQDSPIPLFDTTQYHFPEFNWLGENLDKRYDPCFEIQIDDKLIFYGEKYNPIYRRPDFTVSLPELKPGKHTLTLRLVADYPSAPGFLLLGLDLIEQGADTFEILASPEFFPENTPCPILIRTHVDNITVGGTLFPKCGIHVLTLPPMGAGGTRNIELCSGDCRRTVEIRSITAGNPDGLRLSTSDAVFIHQSPEDFLRYLQWYAGNRIGNTMRFRPCWRWSGSRGCDKATWETILPLLRQLNLGYVLQVDGRELPGKNANPPDEWMAGPRYLGRQAHENDGAFYYWGPDYYENPPQPVADILARSIDAGGIQPNIRPPRNGNRTWRFFDPTNTDSMEEAAAEFVKNLASSRGESTRHSGPSTLFRYFFQAGYDYLETEQMYGPEEPLLGAVRGATKAYGKTEFGAHLATQWSSAPHNTEEHAERYWLSLCDCYLQGATQFNIEEGLWRMESGYVDYDRYSENCLRHLEAHTRFRRFMETHRRRGRLIVPLGVVQGRHDGWCCISRSNVWAREGSKWAFSAPEKSYDLLTEFYPRSKFQAIYERPVCTVEPHGWYSGTPFGPADLFPFEGDFSIYRTVIFLGWHTFRPEDGRKLLDFVSSGGNLLLASPHLSLENERCKPLLHQDSPDLTALLGDGWQQEEKPVIRSVGKGQVRYFPGNRYPSEIESAYREAMRDLAAKTLRDEYLKGWISANEDVNFTVYEDPATEMRIIYLLNIRWWDRKSSSVILHLDGEKIPLEIPYGSIQTLTLAGGAAVRCSSELADVMRLDGRQVTVQSPEPGTMEVVRIRERKILTFEHGITKLQC